MKHLYLFIIAITFFFTPTISQAQSVSLSTGQIDFGTLAFGDSDSVLVELTNLKNEEIDVYQPEFFDVYNTSPFYINQYPTTISGNGTASFYVVYKPIHNITHNSEMVIKTSGNRGAAAIDLIGDCEYENSYYDLTHDMIDEDLEEALQDILDDNYQDYGYNGARDRIFMEIDNQMVNGQGSAQNRITRSYIGTDAVGYTSRSNAQSAFNLNTEHTFPQGFFNQNLPMRADMHHLFVTDVNANSTRANYAFGYAVSNITWQEGGSKQGLDASGTNVFEPRDAQKGKSARAVLYFVVRYQNFGGFLTANQELVLREWCAEFPPNEVDMTRNEDIFNFQNNRNPFVDYPQFLDRIYNIRLDQNRPNVGYLAVSAAEASFGDVSQTGDETFNIVLTNYGERFITVNNLEFTENSTSSFAFGSEVPASIVVNPGESAYLPVICTATSSSDDLEAMLNFSTTAANGNSYEIPVMADFSTGLASISEYQSVVVSPNPFLYQVELKNLNDQVSQIQVYDISGRLCKSITGNVKTIPMNDFQSGIYQMVVTLSNGDIFTRKLVKQ